MALPRDIPCDAIMDSLADGLFTVDTDWNITFFNRAAGRIIGIPPGEALGRKCWDVFHSSLCDGACALRGCIELDRTVADQSIFIVRPDGVKVPVRISAAPLRDGAGRIVGGVETFRDVSDLARLRKELEGVCTLEDIVTRKPGPGEVPRTAAAHRGQPLHGAAVGRVRHGQGTLRPGHP